MVLDDSLSLPARRVTTRPKGPAALTEAQRIAVIAIAAGDEVGARAAFKTPLAYRQSFWRIKRKLGITGMRDLLAYVADHWDEFHPPGCRCSTLWCTAIRLAMKASAARKSCEEEAA